MPAGLVDMRPQQKTNIVFLHKLTFLFVDTEFVAVSETTFGKHSINVTVQGKWTNPFPD